MGGSNGKAICGSQPLSTLRSDCQRSIALANKAMYPHGYRVHPFSADPNRGLPTFRGLGQVV